MTRDQLRVAIFAVVTFVSGMIAGSWASQPARAAGGDCGCSVNTPLYVKNVD